MKRVPEVPKIKPVYAPFRPGLGWRLTATASQKRQWAAYYRFRNYLERSGTPMKHCVPEAFNIDMSALRRRVYELERNSITSAANAISTSLEGLSKFMEAQK